MKWQLIEIKISLLGNLPTWKENQNDVSIAMKLPKVKPGSQEGSVTYVFQPRWNLTHILSWRRHIEDMPEILYLRLLL